jgi:glycosyltransferase involved in cell wall biosynthesis
MSNNPQELHNLMPIPILYVSGQLGFGGAENQLLQLLIRLDRNKFLPTVCNLTAGGGIEEKIREIGIPIVQLKKKRHYSLGTVVALANLMRKSAFKIVHNIGSSAHLWSTPIARATRVPIILYSDHQAHHQADKDSRRSRLNGWVSKFDDLVIAHCQRNEVGLHMYDGVAPSKTRVIYNGVDVIHFGDQRQSSNLHRELGIPQSTPLVCMVARFYPQKAYGEFIVAASMVIEKGVPCHFLCIGDGPERPAMENMVADRGLQKEFSFLGSRKDIPNILVNCDIAVLASLFEGLPITILEAMAAGLPVVTSDVGGCKEAVLHGETGFLISPHDCAGMAQAIYEVLINKELSRSMGRAGRQRVRKLFDISVNCREIQDLYLELLAQNNQGRV